MNYQTTSLQTITNDDELLEGNEIYQVVGSGLTADEYARIVMSMSGMKRYWNCLEKAEKVVEIIKRGRIVLGSLLINSFDLKSQYGYYFNLPLEFHAWVECDDYVIDVALPGVIEKGLLTVDEVGPVLVNRSPFVLAGKPLDWTLYCPYAIYQPN